MESEGCLIVNRDSMKVPFKRELVEGIKTLFGDYLETVCEGFMKSLQLVKTGSLVRKDIPIPVPGADETLLNVTRCAICRTDAKMWGKGHRDLIMPRVLGHEICGIDEKTGRRYALWPGKACGCCGQCRTGSENLCSSMRITGFHTDGGFAEYVFA